MTPPPGISSLVSPPLLLLISSQLLLISCRCQTNIDEPTTTKDTNGTESSEYVFSPEKDYVNKDHIAKLLKIDSRPEEVAPFETEERLWNTPPTPESPWKRAKVAVKKLFGLHKTTVKQPWNVTKELLGDYLIRKAKTLHRYVKYTLLNRPTPNASLVAEKEITEDPLDFWRAHYTDWKFFNKLHFEIMNASVEENHWFYRKLMKDGYGLNLDDIPTTTPMEFDIHRMDGFSTNVTLPTTQEMYPESEFDSNMLDPEVRAALTLRPVFDEAINRYVASISVPTIPEVEINSNQPMLARHPMVKRLQKKLFSFYQITTRDPDEWMDTHEQKKDKKLRKWLVKEEARVLASVERHLDTYTMDFGPRFNSWYAELLKHTSTTMMNKFGRDNEEEVVTKKDEIRTTHYEPPFVRQAIKESRMVNVTMLERWLWDHCSNNTIDWETVAPPTRPKLLTVVLTERPTPKKKEEITEPPPDIITIPEEFLNANISFDKELIDKMYANAQKHMRNLSLLRIDENWHRVSLAMYEAKFTTEPHLDYASAENMFSHKRGNY